MGHIFIVLKLLFELEKLEEEINFTLKKAFCLHPFLNGLLKAEILVRTYTSFKFSTCFGEKYILLSG